MDIIKEINRYKKNHYSKEDTINHLLKDGFSIEVINKNIPDNFTKGKTEKYLIYSLIFVSITIFILDYIFIPNYKISLGLFLKHIATLAIPILLIKLYFRNK